MYEQLVESATIVYSVQKYKYIHTTLNLIKKKHSRHESRMSGVLVLPPVDFQTGTSLDWLPCLYEIETGD